MLLMKFDYDWPDGFREISCLKVWTHGRTQVWVPYYKLTLSLRLLWAKKQYTHQCSCMNSIKHACNTLMYTNGQTHPPGYVAQSEIYLAADPGIPSSIPARSHTFIEIDHELISTAIHLLSSDSRKVVVNYKWKYLHKVRGSVKINWELFHISYIG